MVRFIISFILLWAVTVYIAIPFVKGFRKVKEVEIKRFNQTFDKEEGEDEKNEQ